MRVSGFISKAACRGYRPQRFASHAGRQRPHLIARLAKERGIARFVVAPDGYGKTSLLVDYAETMFDWAHVFYINAKSPCFIRDLDNDCIATACIEVDSDVKLVIVEDLPQLDAPRVKRFSDEIDALLAHDCEVIVSCVPSCDLLGAFQFDRMRISATDLLLTDEELDSTRSEEERMRLSATQVPASGRVPVLVWGATPEAVAAFVSGSLDERLPSDVLLAACSALILRKGSFDELSELGSTDAHLDSEALDDYPHLGFDAHESSFETPSISIDVLYRATKSDLDAIVARSRFSARDELVQAWARILLRRGLSADRACDVMRVFGSSKHRLDWLLDHARELVRQGCFFAMLRLVNSLKGLRCSAKDHLLAIEALCLRMLGDEENAVLKAKRCAFQANAAPEARVVSLLIVARHAPSELRTAATGAIADLAVNLQKETERQLLWHEVLAMGWASAVDGLDALGATWAALHDARVDGDMLCVLASWLFVLVGEAWSQELLFDGSYPEIAERFVRARFSNGASTSIDFFAASAGLSMEQAHMAGMPYAEGPLQASLLLDLRHVETAMLVQRRSYERSLRDEQLRRANQEAVGRFYDNKRPGLVQAAQRAVPIMELNLFGRLDVSIGGVPVNQRKIARKQVRVLLVLLVANHGRDLSRDAAAQAMWPTRELKSARKNFYTTWSQLRRAVALEDGSCPYLIRHQYGCRLDERYVHSDFARFDDLCRELQFGRVDFEEWLSIYSEIDRDYSGEIMPFEEQNHLVVKIRDDCRNRLVDTLVTAATRLIDSGGPQHAIWFARMATERANTREDAYMVLMRAQAANGQRTAAMMTYLACRRILNDDLGIDPSPEMTALYESLLEP